MGRRERPVSPITPRQIALLTGASHHGWTVTPQALRDMADDLGVDAPDYRQLAREGVVLNEGGLKTSSSSTYAMRRWRRVVWLSPATPRPSTPSWPPRESGYRR